MGTGSAADVPAGYVALESKFADVSIVGRARCPAKARGLLKLERQQHAIVSCAR